MILGMHDEFQLCPRIELKEGSLQQLALSVIVDSYPNKSEEWIKSMPCVPLRLRQEICKRLMYKCHLDSDLFALCLEPTNKEWDMRSIEDGFTDRTCEALEKARETKVLRLSYPSCSTEALIKMLGNMPDLRLMEIMNTKEMNDAVMEVVAEKCKKLEEINVKGTSVTDEALRAISENGLKLTELDISQTSVTIEGIKWLYNGPIKETLKLLRFNKCPMLGRANIVRDTIIGFPNLKDYSFDFNGEDDEAEIARVLAQFPQPSPRQNMFFNIPF